MLTYQDFLKATDTAGFIASAISRHMGSEAWKTARDADTYDRQRNVTVNRLTRLSGERADGGSDGSGLCLASNWFNRLNTQRCSYLLGNGVSFNVTEKRVNAQGVVIDVDVIKERLGPEFDNALYEWGYQALIHGVSFAFWNVDRLYVFPLTEFVPLWDEDTGALRAGIRFWRLAADKPMTAVLYTEEGYTTWRTAQGSTGMIFTPEDAAPRAYVERVESTEAGGDVVVGADNYDALPIVPLWGSRRKQSTLVGLREQIDAYDLIQSGFANDLRDVAKVYWLIQNHGGMTKKEMQQFLDDIRNRHIANVNTEGFAGDARSALQPYTQDVPYQGNEAFLRQLEQAMYRDFGGLDVHSLAAGSTNDHIDAAYQPMDEEADQFEMQVIQALQQVLKTMGIEDATPKFKRNRVSNVKETVEAVMLCAAYLDPEAVLDHLPFITVDEKTALLQRLDEQNAGRLDDDGDDDGDGAGSAGGGAEAEA